MTQPNEPGGKAPAPQRYSRAPTERVAGDAVGEPVQPTPRSPPSEPETGSDATEELNAAIGALEEVLSERHGVESDAPPSAGASAGAGEEGRSEPGGSEEAEPGDPYTIPLLEEVVHPRRALPDPPSAPLPKPATAVPVTLLDSGRGDRGGSASSQDDLPWLEPGAGPAHGQSGHPAPPARMGKGAAGEMPPWHAPGSDPGDLHATAAVARLASEIDVIVQTSVEAALKEAGKKARRRIREHMEIVLPEILEELARLRSER